MTSSPVSGNPGSNFAPLPGRTFQIQHYAILLRTRCVQVVAQHGVQRVDIIDHADIIDADLMIAEVMHVLSILGPCAEIACRHLGVELRMHLTAIGSDCARTKAKEQ